ncbi:hypothetical protein F2Q69_00041941 [Brassica cretica]|uniref:Uncharacterized protein n=1 Tax=Brassica cretica TaxID=69181 RepID=A0A8S9NJP8_BRACR|nr:hypothetical protein F2Q69_00041941 [Brassica cretica]
MVQLVRLVVGDWERGAQGRWRFNRNHIESKYDVQLKENESYSSLVATVKEKYRLDQFLLPTEHVLLTYELPDWMKETDEYTSPPLEIKDDRDVEVFMAVRVDCVWLELYVTYGDADVSRYRRLTAMEEGLILIANPRPAQQPLTRWRGAVERGYLLASEDVLMEICTTEELLWGGGGGGMGF